MMKTRFTYSWTPRLKSLVNRSCGACAGMNSSDWYSKVPSAWSRIVSSGSRQSWLMCLYSSWYSSSETSSRERAHRAFMEFSVSGSGASCPSPASGTIRMGQVMKSEYRLTISRIFHSEV